MKGFTLGIHAAVLDQQEKDIKEIARNILLFKSVECANPLRTDEAKKLLEKELNARLKSCRDALAEIRMARELIANKAGMVSGGDC